MDLAHNLRFTWLVRGNELRDLTVQFSAMATRNSCSVVQEADRPHSMERQTHRSLEIGRREWLLQERRSIE